MSNLPTMNINMDMLKALNGEANKYNSSFVLGGQAPLFKVSSVPGPSMVDLYGKYVIGQKRGSDGALLDRGTLVDKLVFLQVRSRYSRYIQKDPKGCCTSPVFSWDQVFNGRKIRGDNFGYICGNGCPYRHEEPTKKCKTQWVMYALAITPDGEERPCIGYFGGSKYMPFQDYIKNATVLSVNGSTWNLPLFAFDTKLLPPTAEMNGAVEFFVPVFERGEVFAFTDVPRYERYREAANELERHIDQIKVVAHEDEVVDAGNETEQVKTRTFQPTIRQGQGAAAGVQPEYLPPTGQALAAKVADQAQSEAVVMDDLPWVTEDVNNSEGISSKLKNLLSV